MSREPVGRVKMTGDPIEDSASALVLAQALHGGVPIKDEDIAYLLKHNGVGDSPANIAAVRKRLP